MKKESHQLDGFKLHVTLNGEFDEEDRPGQHGGARHSAAAGTRGASSDDGGWSAKQSQQQKPSQQGSGSRTRSPQLPMADGRDLRTPSSQSGYSQHQTYKKHKVEVHRT